jgi:hypothetical protein
MKTFVDGVAAFNKAYGVTPPNLADVAKLAAFYDEFVVMVTRHRGAVYGKANVLQDLLACSPTIFGPNFPGPPPLKADPAAGIVTGCGPYMDTDSDGNDVVQLHFIMRYALRTEGWILLRAEALPPHP